ncbi:hypothetical protein [Spartinivicinus ruber]|uniref:hypothetical protein n=1 Tax=Spartinivicinus ruber TaxID=2683272 RepID=UPI0013CFB218|nr:hypothetical protein [Spartinivicinus ruber]
MKKNNPLPSVSQLTQLSEQLHTIVNEQDWEQFIAFDQQCREALSQLSIQVPQPAEVITALNQLHNGYQLAIDQYEQHRQQLANQLRQCQKGIAGVTTYQKIQN